MLIDVNHEVKCIEGLRNACTTSQQIFGRVT